MFHSVIGPVSYLPTASLFNGNCQETIILVQDWWNQNKTLGIGLSQLQYSGDNNADGDEGWMLVKQLSIGRQLLLDKDADFRALCVTHHSHIQEWNSMSQESKVVGPTKWIEMSSQKWILEYILGEEESLYAANNYKWLAKVSVKRKAWPTKQLSIWHEEQKKLMHIVNMESINLSADLMKNCDLLCLFLPSSFMMKQRDKFELNDLASMEAHLHVGAAWDLVAKIKRSTQILDGSLEGFPAYMTLQA
ncbi:hypothetical protein IW262DRAFT_1293641 [Armillaria fumosa]|nr:hypothetical protein IW262DRAFT_1293641 [Armillaria fumosa]